MASCSPNIDIFIAENSDLSVSNKYNKLMEDTLAEGSLYERVKDTYFELFDKLNVSESEKIQLVSTNISNLANTISAQAMTTALAWAKEERDGAYVLAHTKAQTEGILAEKELTAESICKTQNETQLVAAQLAEIQADTIRKDALNVAQVDQVEAQRYAQLAEAYRKSGKVDIGVDTDGLEKGLTGDLAGHTYSQTKMVDRQILSFDDSMRNHAANAGASLFGQMLSAETPIDKENDPAYQAWLKSLQELADYTPPV